MKIIISRKGFDAENGGIASPIMPDGAALSLPIPCEYDEPYESLEYNNRSYLDILKELNAKKVYTLCGHFDPDLSSNTRKQIPFGWRPIFGQCGAAESHLENNGVSLGDIFLYFGWFRQTEEKNGVLRFVKGSPDIHMFFGYLQIGEIIKGDEVKKYSWHPHSYRVDDNNTMYVASQNLSFDGENTGLPGAGTFKYSDELVLTMPGMAKSRWKLPDFFKEVKISCHSKESFKPEGYFQSVRIGQEFVVSEDARVTEWAKNIIINNVIT